MCMFGTAVSKSSKLYTGRLVADELSVSPEIATEWKVSAKSSTRERNSYYSGLNDVSAQLGWN